MTDISFTNVTLEKPEIYRKRVIQLIENFIVTIISDISELKLPQLSVRSTTRWENITFDGRNHMKRHGEAYNTNVNFSILRSRNKFMIIIHMLSKIHKLLRTKTTCSKREIYYQNISLFKSQITVDSAINYISNLLDVPPWELNITTSCKGLAAGPIALKLSNNEMIKYSVGGGVMLPQNINDIKEIRSSAKYILIVEKDAAFQKLLDESLLKRHPECLLVTSKGFPDVNTRLFLRKLKDNLNLSLYALVDADPYGIEIMCVYRYGSLTLSPQASILACPEIKWLGIHPRDIRKLNIPTIPMTQRDISKLQQLLTRPSIESNGKIQKQIKYLLKLGQKAEIEGVYKFSTNFLSEFYIPQKLSSEDFY